MNKAFVQLSRATLNALKDWRINILCNNLLQGGLVHVARDLRPELVGQSVKQRPLVETVRHFKDLFVVLTHALLRIFHPNTD